MNLAPLRRVVFVTTTFVVLVLGAYVVNFAVQLGWGISSEQAVWGQFGDYVGGVLNPIFGFLAFIAVLWTLHLQATQLTTLKQQAEIEEVQRLLASISREADALLNHRPKALDERIPNEYLTVYQVISGIGTAFINQSPHAEEIKRRSLAAIQFSITALAIELHQMVWVLQEHQRIGGAPTISQFYRRRYEVVICWLDQSGLLGPNERIRQYFEPERLVAHLRAAQ